MRKAVLHHTLFTLSSGCRHFSAHKPIRRVDFHEYHLSACPCSIAPSVHVDQDHSLPVSASVRTEEMATYRKASTSLHQLPPELTDVVIDHLHDDRNTLLRCSVVCSTWLQPSRYHLFYDICVDSTKLGRSFPEFLSFLYNAQDLCANIRRLSLKSSSSQTSVYRYIGPFLLYKLFDRLPFLRDLELENLCWEPSLEGYHGESLVDWPLLSRPLNSLVLRQLIMISGNNNQNRTCQREDIFDLLSIFSSLKCLELDRIRYSRINGIPSMRAHPRLQVQQLHIDGHGPGGPLDPYFFDLFSQRIILDDLHTFNARCRGVKELQLVGSFIQAVNLTELSLDLTRMQELVSSGMQRSFGVIVYNENADSGLVAQVGNPSGQRYSCPA
jgi:hypothetical protein